jgi:hypothetical protein
MTVSLSVCIPACLGAERVARLTTVGLSTLTAVPRMQRTSLFPF